MGEEKILPPAETHESYVERRMSVIEHLEELRRRLIICIVVIAAGWVICYFFASQILELLKKPAGDSLGRLKFFQPAEGFMAYLNISLKGALALTSPVILYQLWAFVSPGLKPHERRYGSTFIIFATVFFIGGCLFAYFLLLPPSLHYLLQFNSAELEPLISVGSYVSFTSLLILCCGLVFEMPVIAFFLTKLRIVTPVFLRRQWRYAFFFIVLAAAIITPTGDPFNLALLALPMLGLYEVSIWASRLASPPVRKAG